MTQPSQPSLLLVDTNAQVIFDASSELAALGYRVLVAQSVDQAIAIGRQETFKLLLCCEPLDVADGTTLLRFLRRNKRLRQLRLVIKQPCQAVGVCLKVIHGEPVYCLGRNGIDRINALHLEPNTGDETACTHPHKPDQHALLAVQPSRISKTQLH